jgi:hypothetical protein
MRDQKESENKITEEREAEDEFHETMGHMHKPLVNAFTCISER